MIGRPTDESAAENDASEGPTIALSARWYTFPQRFRWLAEHGFALEYTADPAHLERLPEHVDPLIEEGVPVRYHGFFPNHEFAHRDETVAQEALLLQQRMLDLMQGRGEPVITVHIGLHRQAPLDPERAVAHLTRLVEHGRQLGITVCLENLRRGLTSDPQTVLHWAQSAGAMITLDVGHAVGCARVQAGELSPLDYVDVFGNRLLEVHMYEREADRHYPPRNMAVLGPIVDRLLHTHCAWWTIELDDLEEALATRDLLREYMQEKKGKEDQEIQ